MKKQAYASKEEAAQVTRQARSKAWATPFVRVETPNEQDKHVLGSHEAADAFSKILQKKASITKIGSFVEEPIQLVKLALSLLTAPELSHEEKQNLHNKFKTFSSWLDQKGVYAGTRHRRIVIPKNKLSEPDLKNLGFESVLAAIPEAGQDRFRSFRHPDNLYHIHSHGDQWTMHRDEHPAATMLARSKGLARATIEGIPHVVTEGLPGLGYYLSGKLRGRKSTANVVKSELPEEYQRFLQQIPDTAKAAAVVPSVETATPPGVATRLKKRQRGWHFEKEPGFHDVKAKFDEATRKNSGIKMAAILDALRTYGIDPKVAGDITEAQDPVSALTQVLKTKDFGFGGTPKDQGKNYSEFSSWGPPTGASGGDAASRLNAGGYQGMSYGGV